MAALYLGSRTGLATSPSWSLIGEHDGDLLGYSVSGCGDLNRDGFDDIVVGEIGYDGQYTRQGRARVFLGGRAGIRPVPAWEMIGHAAIDQLGEVVSKAGDLNGDGYDDLWISARSGVLLFYGRPGHLGKVPDRTFPGGGPFAGVGDINSDGFDDAIVHTHLYLGSPSGLTDPTPWLGGFGEISGHGDVNGDGYGDVLIGEDEFSNGPAILYLGTPHGLPPLPAWNVWDTSFYYFALHVSLEGDVNGDGYADVVISAAGHRNLNVVEPSVFVYLGGPGLPGSTPDWRGMNGAQSPTRTIAVADVDGDGASEVLFSDPSGIVYGTPPGAVYLYSIGPGYPAPRVLHERPYAVVPEGTPITLEAQVVDSTHAVDHVEIHYRLVEELEELPPIPMPRIDGNLYRGVIPAPASFSSGLVYSIHGIDDYGILGKTELVGIDYESSASRRIQSAGKGPLHVTNTDGGLRFETRVPGRARVYLFDAAGRRVATLLDSWIGAGSHRLQEGGELRSSGIYFYRIETGEGTSTGKIVRLR
jgi:hypothetical protein